MFKIIPFLKWIKYLPRQYRLSRNPNVQISSLAKIGSYGGIALCPGSNLRIGAETGIHCSIITEHSDAEIVIGNRSFIGGSSLIAAKGIYIGDDVLISWNCSFYDHNSHPVPWAQRKNDVLDWYYDRPKDWSNVVRKEIVVKDKAWIGMGCIILKGVTIGEGAIVGAGSLVTKDVPDWSVVAGSPAKVIRMIPEDER